jgi:hypothetical protein
MNASEVALTLVLMDTYFMSPIDSTSGRIHSEFVGPLFLQSHREAQNLRLGTFSPRIQDYGLL